MLCPLPGKFIYRSSVYHFYTLSQRTKNSGEFFCILIIIDLLKYHKRNEFACDYKSNTRHSLGGLKVGGGGGFW